MWVELTENIQKALLVVKWLCSWVTLSSQLNPQWLYNRIIWAVLQSGLAGSLKTWIELQAAIKQRLYVMLNSTNIAQAHWTILLTYQSGHVDWPQLVPLMAAERKKEKNKLMLSVLRLNHCSAGMHQSQEVPMLRSPKLCQFKVHLHFHPYWRSLYGRSSQCGSLQMLMLCSAYHPRPLVMLVRADGNCNPTSKGHYIGCPCYKAMRGVNVFKSHA